ncbi:MAG: hypothetical protein ACLQKH_15155 [Steroidobacteraceae bacterium]
MALTPAQLAQMQAAQGTVVSDLNSNNFTGAWDTALGTSSLYGTNYGATTTDPLLAGLETSSGLQQLDPSKQWNSNLLGQYYQAFDANSVYHGAGPAGESLGKNPYGTWGSASGIPGDITANASQEGLTPDVARFVGARPDKSFLDKYGADIAMAGLAIAAPYAIGALAPEIAGGAAIATGGATGAATGLIGSAGAGALYGAAGGALMGGITGGNVGRDALLGGIGGGAAGAISSAATMAGAGSSVSSVAGKVGGNMSQQLLGTDANGNPVYGNPTSATAGGGSIFSALGAIGGAVLGGNAASSGATQIQNAAGAAANTEAGYFGTTQAGFTPALQTGQGASNLLGQIYGGGGMTPANYSSFMNTPGYQFSLNQGVNAVNRNAASGGNLYSSNTLGAVNNYAQGAASTNYQNYINNLTTLAGQGVNAATGIGTAATQTGQGVASAQLTGGTAGAAGTVGAANGYSNLLGSLAGNNAFTGALTSAAGAIGSGVSNMFSSTNPAPLVGNAMDTSNMGLNSSGVPNSLALPDPSTMVSTGDIGSNLISSVTG